LDLDRPVARPLDSSLISLPHNDFNLDLIDLFIKSLMLLHNLKALATTLRHYKDLQFYTDGSLQRDQNFIDSMSIGWICINNKNFTFFASTILWSFSTKAEMLACLTTLIVALIKAKVTLFTNSVITITGFNRIDEVMQLSVRK